MVNLRERRRELGLSCPEIAKKLQVSQQAVYKWEVGAAFPSTAKLPQLAKILGCTIDELFDLEGNSA